MSQQQHLPPFPFGGSVPFQPAQHQTSYPNMPATNPAPPQSVPQMQQAAFTQNSQLPGLEMASFLQGITPEQLAYIGQLYQSGLIPLPQAQALPAVTNAQAQPAVQQNGTANVVAQQEEDQMLVDKDNGDREDGELSPQREPDFLHPPPTGPRKRSGSVHMRPGHDNVDKRAKRQPSPPRQPQGYDRRRPEPRTDGHSSSPPRSQFRQRKAKQDAAKEFVLAMYRAGYAFDDLARELGDARVLRVLFTDLGLNAPNEKPQFKQPPSKSTSVFTQAREKNQSASASATPAQGSPLSTTVAKPAIKPIAKPLAIAKAPATADRSAYLARLQAAKNKKNEASPAGTEAPPVATPATSQAPQVQPPPSTAPIVPVQTQPTPPQPKKAKVQTELIRQRLKALQSEQARKQEAERLANAAVAASSEANVTPATPSANLPTPQTPARSTNGNPQNAQVPGPMNTTIVQEPPAAISAQPAPAQASDFTSQFPGLPGLFMTGTPPQVSAALPKPTTPDVAPKSVTAPVPAVDAAPSSLDSMISSEAASSVEADADFAPYKIPIPAKQSVASSGQATPKHPFNQSRYDSNDDSVIIHVSDEEDSEIDELEVEEEVAPAPAPKSAVPVTKPGPLRNFPAPSISANASAPSTPGATTPGGSAYERKMQEINEMHRRIAEMQKQPRKVKAKPLSPTIPSTTSVVLTSSATNALPGLTSVTNNASVGTDIATQPVEQQQQQMEAKLAQLEEEAETISEQRQAASQTSLPTAAQQASGVPDADSTTSSDDDDDDAMDLSSGDEREPDETADDNEPSEADMDLDSDSAPIPSHSVSANELATMSDSGSDSSDSSDSPTDSEGEDSEDDYEPAPAVPDVAGADALPISTDHVSQDEAPTSTVTSPEVVSTMPTPQTGASPQDLDLAPELQPPRTELGPSNVTPEATTKPYYKPYESPLRMFKDYRFHPQFSSDVQGGFKSLTYSNKLDPTETMCPNELSNGTCQDQSCSHQHFYNTAINDGELLKDLGTRNAPWKTEEERIRWSNGLSEIIKQLRDSNQGTDVNAIAARIAQYRRDFVGNPDQILNLKPASAPQ